MKIVLLTCLTMVAFAANSILNRLALSDGDIDALSFGVIRLCAGAIMLATLVLLRDRRLELGGAGRAVGVTALFVYIFGFSLAYESLDAGLGALILFGLVQITMFTEALIRGERPALRRWLGAGVAFAGLVWLLWPGHAATPSLWHAGLMALAGIAWGVYSIGGRGASDALGATAANFCVAAAVAVVGALATSAVSDRLDLAGATAFGLSMAILAGAVTSGLGYALWYTVLPRLRGTTAAVTQLTVPVIAILGGSVFLSEQITSRLLISAALVLGGVLLTVTSRR
ncbi:DMT family transporter [Marivita sp.]|uniref:DMT family transporter n=1 Tax=Marivita sp. TaxID=2003365 RepID=UPI0025BDD782|nr:DMT family transporter [Marivita sp.]